MPVGTLVDRIDRRLLTTVAATMTGFIGLGLGLASASTAPVAVYYALLLIQGCVSIVHAPAAASLIPLIIPRGELVRTNRISSSLQELAAIIGPALAGLALLAVAPSWIYAMVAITGHRVGRDVSLAARGRARSRPRRRPPARAGTGASACGSSSARRCCCRR